MSDTNDDNKSVFLYQGNECLGGDNPLKEIKQKISELSNVKNVGFLTGHPS